jgi:predicted O-methyltransferase YrrM
MITDAFDPTEKLSILEIGSFEGASSVFIADTMLLHPESKLICVDPFCVEDTTTPVDATTETVFLRNTSKSSQANKITHVKKFGADFYKENVDIFDFIYIDGSHVLDDITIDFNHCLDIVRPNGIIWMDDYRQQHIAPHIDNLFEQNKDKLKIIYKEYQIAFQRL